MRTYKRTGFNTWHYSHRTAHVRSAEIVGSDTVKWEINGIEIKLAEASRRTNVGNVKSTEAFWTKAGALILPMFGAEPAELGGGLDFALLPVLTALSSAVYELPFGTVGKFEKRLAANLLNLDLQEAALLSLVEMQEEALLSGKPKASYCQGLAYIAGGLLTNKGQNALICHRHLT